jgi:hypothetical protein
MEVKIYATNLTNKPVFLFVAGHPVYLFSYNNSLATVVLHLQLISGWIIP